MAYVFRAVDSLQKKPWVDGGNCVSLVKEFAPGLQGKSTTSWREGARAKDSSSIAKGTAIATFEHGRYPRRAAGRGNHAAFFLWKVAGGMYVMDQFTYGSRSGPTISRRFIASLGKNKDGSYVNPSNDADAFSVIE